MTSFLAILSLSAAKSRIFRATENSIVVSDSAWLNSLRTSVAAPCAPAGDSLILSGKVTRSVPGCDDCACKEREHKAIGRRIATRHFVHPFFTPSRFESGALGGTNGILEFRRVSFAA